MMLKHALAVFTVVVSLGCTNPELSRAQFAATLDQRAACALTEDYFHEVAHLRASEVELTCSGEVSGGTDAATLEGYTLTPEGKAPEKVSLCLVRGYRWLVMGELAPGEKCAAPNEISKTRVDSEAALRAVEDLVRLNERDRVRTAAENAAQQALVEKWQSLVRGLETHPHHESLCRDLAFPSSEDRHVRFYELATLLAPSPKEGEPWSFVTGRDAPKQLSALDSQPHLLLFATVHDGSRWPAEQSRGPVVGRYHGWAMLVATETGKVECETELHVELTEPLDRVRGRLRQALIDQDEDDAKAELETLFLETAGTPRSAKNMNREGDLSKEVLARRNARIKVHQTVELSDVSVTRFGLTLEFLRQAKESLRYLTDGNLKLRLEETGLD